MRRPRLLACLLASCAAALAAAPAGAQRLTVPLDLSQGAYVDAGEPTPYTGSVRIAAMWGLGGEAFRVGPSGAVTYANPEWEVAGGVRASLQVLALGNSTMAQALGLDAAGVFLSAEQLFGTGDRRPAAAGLVADLLVMRLGTWVVHDWEHDATSVELSVGTSLETLVRLLGA